MNRILITPLILCVVLCASPCGYGQVENSSTLQQYDGEQASARHAWRENLGQLVSDSGFAVPAIRYYSSGGNPSVYLTNEVASLVWSRIDTSRITPDTTHRVDMHFPGGNMAADPTTMEQLPGIDNYYLAHTPQGVEGVRSFARVVCSDIYPDIDLHFYSNSLGLKLYFWVAVGGDASRIRMSFAHADAIGLLPGGGLGVATSIGNLAFGRAHVYEILNNGTRHLLGNSGDFYEATPGAYGIVVEPHNPTLRLMIQIDQGPAVALTPTAANPEWGTFYGGEASDVCVDMDLDWAGNLYVAGETYSTSFPKAGNNIYPSFGNKDFFTGSFNPNYVRRWMTTYGGDGAEEASSIAADVVTNRVYVGGRSALSATPMQTVTDQIMAGAYQESYTNISDAAYIATFNNSDGTRLWVTLFGGSYAAVTGLETDAEGNLFIVGGTFEQATQMSNSPTNGPFPLTGINGSYIQTVNNPSLFGADSDCFIAKFDSMGQLKWSTLFGGNGNEAFYDVGIDGVHGYVYAVGGTTSTNSGLIGCPTPTTYMPLCNAGGYFQPDVNGNNLQVIGFGDGIIARFDLTGALTWSSFFGGPQQDVITSIAVPNEPPVVGSGNPGDIYVTGRTMTQNYGQPCFQTYAGGFPECHQGSQYTQAYGGGNTDAFVAKFDATAQLTWSTYLGGVGEDALTHGGHLYGPRIETDVTGQTYVTGSTTSGAGGSAGLPLQVAGSYYEQAQHGDVAGATTARDGYVIGFAPSGAINYGAYFGGQGDDYSNTVTMNGTKLYVGGITETQAGFPLYNPAQLPGVAWFAGYPVGGVSDAHFAQLELSSIVATEPHLLASRPGLQAYPNPASGFVILAWDGVVDGEAHIELRNHLGQLVVQQDFMQEMGANQLRLPLAGLAAGVYLVSITHAEARLYAKVVVL